MANSYFKFKQFVVNQDLAAMKVGTDGVILGAWARVENDQTILDAGTGTGLLALMSAQRNERVDVLAIDIDANAIKQANGNFSQSIWYDRLNSKLISLQNLAEVNKEKFDHVICNPPYFINSYKSNDIARNKARHTDSLSFEELIKASHALTNKNGRLTVVIPYQLEDDFLKIAEIEEFYNTRLMRLQPTPDKTYVRSFIELSKANKGQTEVNTMILEDKGRHGYSDDYIELTKSFYLAF